MVRTALEALKQHIWISCIVLALVVSGAVWGLRRDRPPGIVRVGMRQFAPYLVEKPGGTADGVVVAILNEAARRRGIPLQWSIHPEGGDQAMAEGTIDLWPLLNLSPEREKAIH